MLPTIMSSNFAYYCGPISEYLKTAMEEFMRKALTVTKKYSKKMEPRGVEPLTS